MPIFDNHFHLDPRGLYLDAARMFAKAGGTHVMLTHLPYDDIPIVSGDDYGVAFERTLKTADLVREQVGVKVFVAVGPYPADLLRLDEKLGLAAGVAAMKRGMDLAATLVREGRATALGEIGRPHFRVASDLWQASNGILQYGMELARDVGCAVVLHTEDPTPETFAEFARMADAAGLPRGKVVKHHAPPLVLPTETHGIIPSVLAREDHLREAIRKGGPFLMETDYIDDPRRPGAVLGPATVPRKTARLLSAGVLTAEEAARIHEELPSKTYGIQIA
ncbi:MAG: TatD family hydrolase [Euryarchaeota archaeon]|nr:TatD family hydrolase [Euryarchaeota archaeon]